jgi:hypothetical protein
MDELVSQLAADPAVRAFVDEALSRTGGDLEAAVRGPAARAARVLGLGRPGDRQPARYGNLPGRLLVLQDGSPVHRARPVKDFPAA